MGLTHSRRLDRWGQQGVPSAMGPPTFRVLRVGRVEAGGESPGPRAGSGAQAVQPSLTPTLSVTIHGFVQSSSVALGTAAGYSAFSVRPRPVTVVLA